MMENNRFQIWIVTTLVFWGIPAFLLWCALGVTWQVVMNWQTEDAFRATDKALVVWSQRADDCLKDSCNSGFDRLCRFDAPSLEFEDERRRFESSFPGDLVQFIYFDRSGKVLNASKSPVPVGIERFFDYISHPFSEPVALPADRFSGLKGIHLYPCDMASRMRGLEGRIIALRAESLSMLRPPNWLFFRRNREHHNAKIGGILALFFNRGLTDSFKLERGLPRVEPSVVSVATGPARSSAPVVWTGKIELGFQVAGDRTMCPANLSPEAFDEVVRGYDSSPADRFRLDNVLVLGKRYGDSALIFACTMIPSGPARMMQIVFLVYGIVSFILILWWRGVCAGTTTVSFGLSSKLLFLFTSGVAFPLVMSTGFAGLYLEEKKKDILEESRKAAFKRLEHIEEKYEQALLRRELDYHRLVKEYYDQKLTLEQVAAHMQLRVKQNLIEFFFIVNRDSRILYQGETHRHGNFHWLYSLPMSERLSRVTALARKNLCGGLDYEELECLMGRMPLEETEAKLDPVNRKMVETLVSLLLEDTFQIAHRRLGKPPLPPRDKATSVLEGVLDDEVQGALKTLKGSMGKLVLDVTLFGRGGGYGNVLTRPTGHDSFLLFVNHSHFNLQHPFLEDEFSERNRDSADGEMRAIGYENRLSPNYPEVEGDPFQIVHDRLNASKGESLSVRMTIGGRELEVSAIRAKKLSFIDLVHATPVERLTERLEPFRFRMVMFILGTCVFSFLIAIVLLRTLVLPIRAIIHGLQAIRNKEYSCRVPVMSGDEMGRLCESVNRTIIHLGEMEMASGIQMNLLPASSLSAGRFEIMGCNEMTQSIGGDFYDYYSLDSRRCAVILGDVAGHGVSAALVTAMAKAGFSILCPMFADNPELILRKLNSQFLQILRKAKMMTCFLGVLDVETGVLTAVNAGQSAPILRPDGGASSFLVLVSNPLGILEKIRLKVTEIDISRMDLVLYSDGLVEATTPAQEPVGYDRFMDLVGKAFEKGEQAVAQAILSEVRGVTHPIPWNDDATVVVIRRCQTVSGEECQTPENPGAGPDI